MYNYIIHGGRKLSGETYVSGSKNATLPILAATIINGKTSKLYNVPDIEDVKTTLEILKSLGCKIKKEKNKLIINSKDMKRTEIPEELMRKLRSSVIIVGAILTRFKIAQFSYPGGCDIGARPIDLHLENFKKIGIKIDENSRYIECKCDKIVSKNIELDFPSVGATENLILASILGNHEITINNAAKEPEIIDLVNFLNRMGAKIYGAGSNIIKIVGVNILKDVSYKIMPDRIEAGTLLVGAAITRGNVKINNVIPEHISPILNKLEETGCEIKVSGSSVILNANKKLKAVDIKTMPYPGFPTDLQPIFSSLLTTCNGTSIITENIFENRFKFMQEIQRMGAKVNFQGKTMIIKGVRKLHGAKVESTDLRGGASLVLAGLSAKGITKVSKLEHLIRGYENLDIKFNSLGANIIREEEGE
jgi:UDP-N-acetylglucosamine 1-carboxyvinyltransferase